MGKKRRLKYRLESIPGIGPGFRKKLMQEFKTIKRISETEPEVLAARVPGLGHQRAQAIYDHFHPPDETSTIKKERNEAE